MKHYTIKQLVSMPNEKLQAHLNRQIIRLLAEGIPEGTIKQFFITAAEVTLRLDEGRMTAAQPPIKKNKKHSGRCS